MLLLTIDLKSSFLPVCAKVRSTLLSISDCEEVEPPSQPSAIPFVFDYSINIQCVLCTLDIELVD